MDRNDIAIIFQSGSYDRVSQGFSIALSALAIGWDVKCFFSYWSLEYLSKEDRNFFRLEGGEDHKKIIEDKIKKGHIQKISDLMVQAKTMGVSFYVCTNSMGLLNIARNELVDEVDKAAGLTTFLAETEGYRMLFI